MDKYDEYPMSTKIVLHLIDPLLDKGYYVTTDNFYTSLLLSDYLLQCKTDMHGTLLANRKDLPPKFGSIKHKIGEIKAYQRDKAMVLKWQYLKTICALSKIHNQSSFIVKSKKGDEVIKPQLISDNYTIDNYTMGGVDRVDRGLSYYEPSRKQPKSIITTCFDISSVRLYLMHLLFSRKLRTLKKLFWNLEWRLLKRFLKHINKPYPDKYKEIKIQ